MQRTSLTPGSSLGKYEIVAQLGRGGMGVVYLAEDTNLERRVALKVLSSIGQDDDFESRFRREAKTIAQLSHPGIVHINSFDIVDGIPFIEMEFIDGDSLLTRMDTQFISPAETAGYAHDILSTLAYCHANGILHRDIKPSNILIDPSGKARLVDFGIAKILDSDDTVDPRLTQTGALNCTPIYAPPEAWDLADPNEGWDIYSLGAVIYEVLTGSPPYEATSPLDLMRKVDSEKPQPLRDIAPGVSKELGDLVDAMIARDIQSRPESAAVALASIESTPEFKDYQSGGGITISGSISQAILRRKRKKSFSESMRSVGAAAVIGVALVSIFFAIPFVMTALTDTPAQSAQLLNDEATIPFATNRPSVYNIRLQAQDGMQSEQWLITPTESNSGFTAIAQSLNRIALLELVPQDTPNTYTISGDWSASTITARFGSASGTIQFHDSNLLLAGNITYRFGDDGSKTTAYVLGERADPSVNPETFLATLENSERIVPLIQNELLPREFEWAQSIYDMLPTSKQRPVELPIEPDPISIRIDGHLDEAQWKDRPENTLQITDAHGEEAALQFVRDLDALYFAIKFKKPKNAEGCAIDLGILSTYATPLSLSPRLLIHVADNGEPVKATYGSPENAQPISNIQAERTQTGNEIYIEFRIPLTNFPQLNDHLRINAHIYSRTNDGEQLTLAKWGHKDPRAIWRGAVLQFV